MPTNWIPVPDSPEMFFTEKYIYQLPDNELLVLGKYRVIFGYRLQVGFVDMLNNKCSFIEKNICCGSQRADYELLQNRIMEIIGNNPPDDPLKGIPSESRIKPYFNDPEFCKLLNIEPLKRNQND
jgi:hypothetical protein